MIRVPFTDFSKLPMEIMAHLVNMKWGTSFAAEQLSASLPQVVTAPPSGSQPLYNTKINIGAEGHRGHAAVYYTRVPLTLKIEEGHVPFEVNEELKISELIEQINERFGLQLTSADYIDEDLPALLYMQSKPFELKAAPTSLIWVGCAKIMLCNLDVGGIPLDSVITDIYLDTFDFNPEPVEPSPC